MEVSVPPSIPPTPVIDWGTLVVGFVLGVIGSAGGAFVQAFASSMAGRRDHQFGRMLRITDDIRHDIERAILLAGEYWAKDGGHADCVRLEGEIMGLHNKIRNAICLVRQLDPKRFAILEAELELDFMDALTGEQFQVVNRPADPAAGARVTRFGGRLSDKIAACSAKPTARRWFSLG
jgi:hypothetical protein